MNGGVALVERDRFSDNMKFILIHLVVIGHFTLELFADPLARGVTNVIYSFHMPVFIFISGYFSKSLGQHRKDVTRIMYAFVVFQCVWYIYNKATGLGFFQRNLFVPTHQNWYLLALFGWKLILPYATFFRRDAVLAVSLVAAFAAGCTDAFGEFLSLHRIVYLFPIFLLGYYCDDLNAWRMRFATRRGLLLIVFVGMLLCVFSISLMYSNAADLIYLAWTPRLGYGSNYELLAARLVGYGVSMIIGAAFVLAVPLKLPNVFSLGKNSINAFLLHMFYVYPVVAVVKWSGSYILAACAVPILILITTILSLDRVNVLIAPLVNLDSLLGMLNIFLSRMRVIGRKILGT